MWCYKGKGAEGGGTSAPETESGAGWRRSATCSTTIVRVKYSFYLSLFHLN